MPTRAFFLMAYLEPAVDYMFPRDEWRRMVVASCVSTVIYVALLALGLDNQPPTLISHF